MYINELEKIDVQNNVQFQNNFKEVVQKIVQIRKEAKFSQEFMAEWLNVDRRKIMALESGALIDYDLLYRYADKFDIQLTININ